MQIEIWYNQIIKTEKNTSENQFYIFLSFVLLDFKRYVLIFISTFFLKNRPNYRYDIVSGKTIRFNFN